MRYMNNLCSLFSKISFVISHCIVRMHLWGGVDDFPTFIPIVWQRMILG
jgi:hypothetical protein